jgi:triosephosphate isomerase
VAGNWKMHGSLASNQQLLKDVAVGAAKVSGVDMAVFVPFPYLSQAQTLLAGSSVSLGAQNVCEFHQGAYTGEVSAQMLQDFACHYVLVGHSERRAFFGESDAQIAGKFCVAVSCGLQPIICVGETLAQRESGQTESIVSAQLDAIIQRAGIAAFESATIAYEPVWAIGTGKTASPAQAQRVHEAIRAQLASFDSDLSERVKILYGGSVKPENSAELFSMPDIDGGLIGGASLVADDFLAICLEASR